MKKFAIIGMLCLSASASAQVSGPCNKVLNDIASMYFTKAKCRIFYEDVAKKAIADARLECPAKKIQPLVDAKYKQFVRSNPNCFRQMLISDSLRSHYLNRTAEERAEGRAATSYFFD